MESVGMLVQLPNKDLWRGIRPPREKGNVALTPAPTPEVQDSGPECLWCGMKEADTPEKNMKAHVEKRHFGAAHAKEEHRRAAAEFLTAPAAVPPVGSKTE